MDKIMNRSKVLSQLFNFLAILYPFLTFGVWLFFPSLPIEVQRELSPISLEHVFWNEKTQILAVLLAIPSAFMSWLFLSQFAQLFNSYSKGEVFTKENSSILHKLSQILTASVLLEILMIPLMGFILSFQNSPGMRILHIAISSREFHWLLAAATLWILSKVQLQAASLADESQLTV